MIVAIYGLGLIGGSLGRALVKHGGHTVLGADVNPSAVLKAEMLSAIDGELTDDTLKTADVVVLALCPHAAADVMNGITGKLKDGATVVDCCGNKRFIVAEMEKLLKKYPNINFIGAHPMAGREFSGISHSTAGLFERSYFILTPVHTPIDALARVRSLFTDIGIEGVVVTTPEIHDRIISYTSQLAHVVSSCYIKNPLSAEHLGFSAGSFRDMTRVAKLNPDMWTELFMDNRDNLVAQIDDLTARLFEVRKALYENDESTLHALLEEGVKQKETAENLRKAGRKDD